MLEIATDETLSPDEYLSLSLTSSRVVLSALASNPSVPSEILERYLSHGIPHVSSAALLNPNLDPHPRRRILGETFERFLGETQSGDQADTPSCIVALTSAACASIDRQIYLDVAEQYPPLPAWQAGWVLLLANENVSASIYSRASTRIVGSTHLLRPRTAAALAGNRNAEVSLLEELGESSHSFPVMQAVASHPKTPAKILDALVREGTVPLIHNAALSNPNLSVRVMEECTFASTHAPLALLSNPSAPPHLVEMWVNAAIQRKDPNWRSRIQILVASVMLTPTEWTLLWDAAHDEHLVRREIVRSARCPVALLEDACWDKDFRVREAAILHENCPEESRVIAVLLRGSRQSDEK